MKEELWSLDNAALEKLYETQLKELNNALLEGVEWECVQDKRYLLTQISKVINKRGRNSNSPAENPNRT